MPPSLRIVLLLATASLAACAAEDTSNPRTPDQPHCLTADSGDTDIRFVDFPDPQTPGVDYDCDGWPREEDCDDQDKDVWPGAPEYNNGKDDDCDGDAEPLYGCGIQTYDDARDRDKVSGRRRLPAAGPGLLLLLAWRRRRCVSPRAGARWALGPPR
ncbi:MAG TPA: putative metal-binding motif-containing protein [Myxococcota bacterium]|nr:putative metal-binding motif-containing protein [Myxococcota bacterium]